MCHAAVSPAPYAAAAGLYYCSGIVEIRKEEGEEGRREVSLVVPLFGNDDNSLFDPSFFECTVWTINDVLSQGRNEL